MEMTSRIQWIDAAKGLGILLIFVGHIWSLSDTPIFYDWMYAFHVPLFFFVSGLTLKTRVGPLLELVVKKARTILVPYFFYALVGYVFYVGGYLAATLAGRQIEQFDYGFLYPLLGILHGTLGDGNLINSPLWFLPALFVTFLVGYAVNTYISHHGFRVLVVAGLTGLGIWIGEDLRIPFGVVPALIALLFFQAGYYFQRFDVSGWIPPSGKWFLLLLLFLLSLAAPVNGFIVVGKGIVNDPILFLLFAFGGILMSVLLVQIPGVHGRVLAWVGQYSLAILVIHMLIIKAVKVLIIVFFGIDLQTMEASLWLGLLVLVVSALIMVPSVYVMERWLPFSLGRKRVGGRSVA